MDRPTGSSHWLIVYGHTPTYVVVNDLWGEPDLIHVTTLNANGIGAVIQPPELGQVLDGGAHRWWWMPSAERTAQRSDRGRITENMVLR